MKVGIVTIYRNINYGSKLQSFALQYSLKKIGVDVVENLLVHKDVQPTIKKINPISKYYNLLLQVSKNPYLLYDKLFKKEISRKIRDRKSKFNQYLIENISESKYSPSEIENRLNNDIQDYNYFICGSDQIWAPNQFDEAYFLGFVKDKSIKVSYATSIGLPLIPDNLISSYKKLISNIGHLSIREKDGSDIVKKITGIDVPVVLDPTLLLTRDEWLEHSVKYPVNESYILCLFLGENDEHREWVKLFSEKFNYKILVLPMRRVDSKFGDIQCYDVGPKEFIGLLSNASVVFTDSYHGMLFSVNLNKKFFSFLRFVENDSINQNSRVLNFLSFLNLTDRIINAKTPFSERFLNSDINWDEVNQLIEEKRNFSMNFLKQSLNV